MDVHDVAGRLCLTSALERSELVAPVVYQALAVRGDVADAHVAEIDPDLADTAAFCEHYGVALDVSANCVIVTGRRAGEERTAACVVLATTRADINGFVGRRLDVRKASFVAIDDAVRLPAWSMAASPLSGSCRAIARREPTLTRRCATRLFAVPAVVQPDDPVAERGAGDQVEPLMAVE